jgi:outer membrane protein TolC
MRRAESVFASAFLVWVFFAFLSPFSFAEERKVSLSGALFETLDHHPGVQIQQERVTQSEGELQAASGQFDWTASAVASKEQYREHFTQDQEEEGRLAGLLFRRVVTDSRREEVTYYSMGLQKQFRSGAVLSPNLTVLDTEDLSQDIENLNRSDLALDITIPLMRGLGEHATGAEEKAARSNLSANRQLSRHNISRRILITANNYWSCLAAVQSLAILEDMEERAEELFDLVDRLVRAGEMEPAVLREAEAQLLERKGDLQESRLQTHEARQALAVSMGYAPQELVDAPLPEGPFPPVVNDWAFDQELARAYIDKALNNRGDYLAAKIGVETEEILMERAENRIKPRLDLGLSLGVSGLSEEEGADRLYKSLYHDHAGPNVFGSLTFEWPIANNAAKGEFIRRRSLVNEALLTAEDLSNNIASEVLVAVARIRSAAKEHRLAASSARGYRAAADHERYKVQEGLSDLGDLISAEDRYLSARAREVEVTRRYASALAEVRYVTGSLLSEEDEGYRLQVRRLMVPPVLFEPKAVKE